MTSSQAHARLTKRRQSASTIAPPAKRKRSESSVATDGKGGAQADAARKYCLAKFEELFVGIFIKYGATRPKAEEEKTRESDGEGKEEGKEEVKDMKEEEDVGGNKIMEDGARPETQADNNETPNTKEGSAQEVVVKAEDKSEAELKPGQPPQDDKPAELTPDQRALLEERARAYTHELEEAVFEMFAEPDKTGKLSVGAKYKYVSVVILGRLSMS